MKREAPALGLLTMADWTATSPWRREERPPSGGRRASSIRASLDRLQVSLVDQAIERDVEANGVG